MIPAMMTQQLPASILTAPLAQTDRRTLSQAWYSALHLAHAQTAPAIRAQPFAASETAASRPNATVSHRLGRERLVRSIVTAPRALPKLTTSEETVPRLRTRSQLVRQIERVFQNARKPVVRSTLTLGCGGGRAYVVLQSNGDRMRLIAICRPADRQRVARALEEARYALTVRGCALETSVGVAPCS